jgi:hypothetical protein
LLIFCYGFLSAEKCSEIFVLYALLMIDVIWRIAGNVRDVSSREECPGPHLPVRDGGRVRQPIVRALERKDALLATGELDRLIASLARHSGRAMILSEMEARRLACTRIGRPLLFGPCGSG